MSGLSVVGGLSSSVDAETNNQIRWVYSEDDFHASSTTIVDDVAYIGTWDSGIFAYETSGEQRWSYNDTEEFVLSAPCVVDGVCYAKDSAGFLYALEAETGDLVWTIDQTFPGQSSPTVYNDRCFVCGEETLAAVDTLTGETEWTSTDILGPVGTGVVIFDGQCIVSGERGVTAHNVETGSRNWAFKEAGYDESGGGPFSSGVVASERTVFVGSDHGMIYAIEAETGNKRWSQSAELAEFLTTPTLSENFLAVIGYIPDYRLGQPPYSNPAGELIIIDLFTDQSNEVITERFNRTPRMTAPTVVGESIVWTTTDGMMIYSRESESTSVVRSADKNNSDPIVVNGEVYLGSVDGVLAIDIDAVGSSSGLRVAQGSTGHHDSWAETASLEIDTLDVTLEETTLEIGDETSPTVTVTFANGREEPALERATLESADPDIARVSADGMVRAVSAGETEIVVSYRDETEHIGLIVEGDDSMPTPGLIGTAVGIGSGAYLLKRARD